MADHLVEVVPGRGAINLVCACGWHKQFSTDDGPVQPGTLALVASEHEEAS